METRRRKIITGIVYCIALTLMLVFCGQGRTALAGQAAGPSLQAERTAFTDISADKPLLPCVLYLTDKGILSGFPDGSFKPSESLTRAQAARIMVLAGDIPVPHDTAPTFRDVDSGHWAFTEIEAAVRADLLSGYPDGTFRPDNTITRAEAVTLLLNLSREKLSYGSKYISDVSKDNWAYPYVETAVEAGLVDMNNGSSFQPDLAMRRGEMARGISAMLALSPSLRRAELTGLLSAKKGSVTLITGGTSRDVTGAIRIGPGAAVITGSGSQAEIIFDDGSGILIDENTQISITSASGFSYMRKNGTGGVAVDKLAVKLEKGRIFGGLASHYEAPLQTAGQKEKYITLASTGLPPGLAGILLAEGEGTDTNDGTDSGGETPWWVEPYTEYERVEVDMPWGVAGIRGTFWMCQVDGTHIISVATGKVDVRAGGSTVRVIDGQYTQINQAGAAPTAPAAMTQALKQLWANINSWVMERLQGIQDNLPLPPAPAILPVMIPVEQPPVLLNKEKAEIAYINSVGIFSQILESVMAAPPAAPTATSAGGGGGGGTPADNTAPAVSGSPSGGTVPANGSITVNFDENIREGANFNGISVTGAGGTTIPIISVVNGSSLIITPIRDLVPDTMYTVFIPAAALQDRARNSVPEFSFSFTAVRVTTIYTVTYSGNGSDGGRVPVDSGSYTHGATVTVLGNTGSLTRSGYTFAGWNTLASGQGISYSAGSTFTMGTANVTLFAKWNIDVAQAAALLTSPGSYTTPETGSAAGTTKISSLNLAGISGATKWQVKVQNEGLSAAPVLDSVPGSITIDNYTAGAGITISAGQHLILYATDDISRIKGYADITVSSGQIAAVVNNITEKIPFTAGYYNSLALKSDGTVAAWGYNSSGQCNVPAGLSGVTAITAGYGHSLALKSDGTVTVWGDNSDSQCNVPAGLSGVTAITAGYHHSLALKSDGTVTAWGDNSASQCNVPTGLSGVTAIAGGAWYSLALKSDGTVVAWGLNNRGECNVPAGLSGVTAIAAGGYHSLALKSDGTVAAWGDNYYGQCNVPGGLSGVTAIAAGADRSLALKNDGTVVAWGQNYYLKVPAGLSGVTAITSGGYHSLALKSDGTVAAWGLNDYNQCNVPTSQLALTTNYSAPAAGAAPGTTKISTLNLSGITGANRWQVLVRDSGLGVPLPDCPVNGANGYTAGADITAAAGQHVLLLAADNSGMVKAYADISISAGQINSGVPAAPVITGITAADSGSNAGLGSGDTITITFDVDTNQPPVADKAAVDTLVDFGAKSFGTVYSGSWTDSKTLVLTVTDAAGGNLAAGDTLALKPGGNLKTANGLSAASTSGSTIGGTFGADQVNDYILYETFDESSLDPSWQVVSFSGKGRYSMSDNPGSLRYYMEGSQVYIGGWTRDYGPNGSWSPGTTLIRPFTGSSWVLDTKISYNLHQRVGTGSTGGQGNAIYIGFGDNPKQNYNILHRNADYYYNSSSLNIQITNTGGVPETFSDGAASFASPDDVDVNEWMRYTYWYRIQRSGDNVSVKVSYDGVVYQTYRTFQLPAGTSDSQQLIMDGGCWATAGSYADWDYVQVGTNPMSIPPAPVITSITADDGGSNAGLGNGDTITITFDVDTNQSSMVNKAAVDALIDFGTKTFGTDYSGAWSDAGTLVLTVTDATGGNLAVGDTLAIKAGGGLKTADGLSVASTSSGTIGGSFGAASTDISGSFTDPIFKQAVWVWLGNTGTPGVFTKQDLTDRMPAKGYTLSVSYMNISSLAGLENFDGTGLQKLDCSYNQLTVINTLPGTLTYLDCSNNMITALPALPGSLDKMYCSANQLSVLPALPGSLTFLNCGINNLTELPDLPASLTFLTCARNRLTALPPLPAGLTSLYCFSNSLISLPDLPAGLENLYCGTNQLTSLPVLPANLFSLFCDSNLLTALPDLPASLNNLTCSNNYINVFSGPAKSNIDNCPAGNKVVTPQYRYIYQGNGVELNSGGTYQITAADLPWQQSDDGAVWDLAGTTNLSDFIFDTSDSGIATVDAGGLITAQNAGNCEIYALYNGIDSEYSRAAIPVSVNTTILDAGSIAGYCFNDTDNDGAIDAGEQGLSAWTVDLFDGADNYIVSTSTGADGSYSFTELPSGGYIIREVLPAGWTCTYPSDGTNYATLGAGQSMAGINFGNIVPDPGISITVTANPTTVSVSEAVYYTYTITNTGNVDLLNIEVTDTLSNIITGYSTALVHGQGTAGDAMYIVQAGGPGPLENTATVRAMYDGVYYEDTYTVTVTVR